MTVATVPSENSPHLIALTDQRNDEIVVVDLDAKDPASDEAVVWRWSPRTASDLDFASVSKRRLDDAKLRYCEAWGGCVVGVTSSAGMAALISYPEGKCLWNASLKGEGPHSFEILPNGLLVLACSGNGDVAQSSVKILSARDKTDLSGVSLVVPHAHGVLWDPAEQVLWALGDQILQAYAVEGTRTAPKASPVEGKKCADFCNGHDLTAVYGDPSRLWISNIGVHRFHKDTCTCDRDFGADVAEALSSGGVKSVNSFRDGVIVATVCDGPENPTARHNTQTVLVFRPVSDANGTVTFERTDVYFPNRDFYKVRVFDPSYQ